VGDAGQHGAEGGQPRSAQHRELTLLEVAERAVEGGDQRGDLVVAVARRQACEIAGADAREIAFDLAQRCHHASRHQLSDDQHQRDGGDHDRVQLRFLARQRAPHRLTRLIGQALALLERLLADLGHALFQRRDRIGRADASLQPVVQQIAPVVQRLFEVFQRKAGRGALHQGAITLDQGKGLFRLADRGFELGRLAEQQVVLLQPPCFAHHVVHARHMVFVIDARQQQAHLFQRGEHQQHEQRAENDVAEQDLAVQGTGQQFHELHAATSRCEFQQRPHARKRLFHVDFRQAVAGASVRALQVATSAGGPYEGWGVKHK